MSPRFFRRRELIVSISMSLSKFSFAAEPSTDRQLLAVIPPDAQQNHVCDHRGGLRRQS